MGAVDFETGVRQMSETSVADQIHGIEVPDFIDSEEGQKIAGAVLTLLSEIGVEGELEDAFDEWKDGIGEAWCKATKSHQWVHDHCGFWGHQYCAWCHEAKYPEISSRCSDCRELMRITEDQYNKTTTSP